MQNIAKQNYPGSVAS